MNVVFDIGEVLVDFSWSSFACVYIDVNGLHELNNTQGYHLKKSRRGTAGRDFFTYRLYLIR